MALAIVADAATKLSAGIVSAKLDAGNGVEAEYGSEAALRLDNDGIPARPEFDAVGVKARGETSPDRPAATVAVLMLAQNDSPSAPLAAASMVKDCAPLVVSAAFRRPKTLAQPSYQEVLT